VKPDPRVFTTDAYDRAIERQGGRCPGCESWLSLATRRWLQQTDTVGNIWVLCDDCGSEVDRRARELGLAAQCQVQL